jgi:hypothetical protein
MFEINPTRLLDDLAAFSGSELWHGYQSASKACHSKEVSPQQLCAWLAQEFGQVWSLRCAEHFLNR